MRNEGLATLAVRRPGPLLLFDRDRGCAGGRRGRRQWATAPVPDVERLAFTGIHVIDPAIFPK
jgi:hypothetical protein